MKIIITSGYQDPAHVGHLECFEKAKLLGDILIVIVNNDQQALRKKGYIFMPEQERMRMTLALKPVNEVFLSIDKDSSVCESIKAIHKEWKQKQPDADYFFAKGGNRFAHEIPEAKLCEELGIKIVDGLGTKVQSSSELVKKAIKN